MKQQLPPTTPIRHADFRGFRAAVPVSLFLLVGYGRASQSRTGSVVAAGVLQLKHFFNLKYHL